jgi:hypothetical protein
MEGTEGRNRVETWRWRRRAFLSCFLVDFLFVNKIDFLDEMSDGKMKVTTKTEKRRKRTKYGKE